MPPFVGFWLLTNLRHSSRCPSLFYFNLTNGFGEEPKKKIEKQRKKLQKTVENKRLDDIEVQKESEKLDKLLNQYYYSYNKY